MNALKDIQFPLAVFWGFVFLVVLLRLLWKHKSCCSVAFVVRHLAFILCVYFGMLWFLYQEQITTLVFGHVVYKHSPEETPAVVVVLGGVILWFAMAVLLLGKNRGVEFRRYVEAFPFLRRFTR